MSLGVVSISTEAAAAFHESRETVQDLELEAEDEAVATEEVQTLDAQEEENQEEEVPPVEEEVVPEDVLTKRPCCGRTTEDMRLVAECAGSFK